MKTKIFTLSCLFMAMMAFGQNYWTKTTASSNKSLAQRWVQPTQFALYEVNLNQLKNDLSKVPERWSADESKTVTFPTANGNFKEYIVQEASVMEPELQAKYPDLRSYVGWEKSNKTNSIRFSVTPNNGISAIFFDGWDVSYLEKYTADHSQYIFYKRSDLPHNDRLFECNVTSSEEPAVQDLLGKAPLVSDGLFRKYRLAISATGEYTTFHGGTVANALAAMVVTMTRVNGVYEKTISVTMVMVANNNLIVYTNAATDPFTNGTPNVMITQNQTNTDLVIGAANYDIGHVFGTNSGGLAGLGVICTANKARGVTGSGAPINDPFDIDYVAHELGHQFGANHTFRASSGACAGNANNNTAYEPGSGSTIMAYAGICGINNLQPNSDAYFHSASVNEMYTVIRRTSDCSVKISNNNQVPTADAGLDYTIPKGTAFVLTGTGTDPDNDPITYLWEQMDRQASTQPPVPTAIGGPVYRSFYPTASNARYFPKMSFILANNLTPTWEVTPSVSRTLNFSLLVNDDKPTGNQAARDLMLVNVDNSGPFVVTSQTANIEYDAAMPLTVTWNVAGTSATPVNTANVQILLSKNGGADFDTVLSASTANNGSATVFLPNENIAAARLMVKANGNIYFAVNSSNFSIKKTLATIDFSQNKVQVYPNPATTQVKVTVGNRLNGGDFTIYDASGRTVKSGTFGSDAIINTEKISTGNYILKIKLKSGEEISEQLMIKH